MPSRFAVSRSTRFASSLALGLGAALGLGGGASAHPHVFVTVEATVNYAKDGSTITGFTHRWTFDEFYTAMATQGLDTNKDGKFSREELSELTKVNMEGLKEFEFFTFPKLGKQALAVADATDAYMEVKDGLLSMVFTAQLKQPVLKEAEGFSLAIYDPTFFIAFNLAKENAVRLSATAPKDCKASVKEAERDAAEAQKLGEAFFNALGGSGGQGFGLSMAQTIMLSCSRK